MLNEQKVSRIAIAFERKHQKYSQHVRNNSAYLYAVLFVLILMIIQHFYGTKWVSRNKTSVNNISLTGNENLP